MSPGGNALFVANSDFDLRFNAGTVAEYDLERIRNDLKPLWAPAPNATTNPCVALGLAPNPTAILQPGPCAAYNPEAPPSGASSAAPP